MWSTAHAPSDRLAHRLASSRLGGVQRSERGAPLTYRSLATYFRTDSLCYKSTYTAIRTTTPTT